MPKIVITGANGFVGSWLTKALVKEGYRPSVLVRPTSDLSEIRECNPELLFGDIGDFSSIEKAFSGADTVFHLAGLVAYKISDRQKMETVNVQGTANVIKACQLNGVRRLIYFSSVVAVGASSSPNRILNEDSPYEISNLNLGYFETKHQAEKLILEAVKKMGLQAIIINPSTIYGPGDAKKGSRSTQLKVARGKFPFYSSGGVSVVDIEDVISGVLAAWKTGRVGERYILSGENLTIQDLFKLISDAAGVRPPSIRLPSALLFALGFIGDRLEKFGFKFPFSTENAHTSTLYHWFSHEKAHRELGFNPRPAKESIKKSVQWMRENGYLDETGR